MKRFLLMMAVACTALAFFACKKQDQPRTPDKTSDLAYLTDGLILEDASGNINGYVYGAGLNEANPYEISVPVSAYDEAVRIFLGLLPKGAQVTANGQTLSWAMTDPEGKSEGEAVLSPSTAPGMVATLTVGSSRVSVRFVSVWPENAEDIQEYMDVIYPVGTSLNKSEVPGFGEGYFVIVRQWTPRECGLMIQPLSTDYTCESIGDKSALPSENLLHQVFLALEAWPGYGEVLGSLDYKYLTCLTRKGSAGTQWCAVNLAQDEEYWLLSSADSPVRKVLVYCFAPDGDKIKCWSSSAVVKFDPDGARPSGNVPDYGDGGNNSWNK